MVPMSVSAVLNAENISFTCSAKVSYSVYGIEWTVVLNQGTSEEVTIKSGQEKSTLSLPPTRKYNNANIMCKLISDSDMPSSESDPANLSLQCKVLKSINSE